LFILKMTSINLKSRRFTHHFSLNILRPKDNNSIYHTFRKFVQA